MLSTPISQTNPISQKSDETVSMSNMCAEIDGSTELTAAVETCSAQGAYGEMKKENGLFIETVNTRTSEQAASEDPIATESAKQIENSVEFILQYAEVMSMMCPNAENKTQYESFIKEVEIVNQEFITKIKMRLATKEEEEEEITNA